LKLNTDGFRQAIVTSGQDRQEEGGGNVSDRISIVIAEDSLLVRDSVSRALSMDPMSRSSASPRTTTQRSNSSNGTSRRFWSPMYACRQPRQTKGFGWRSGCARRIRTSG
jgi:hypothetical protein